MPLPLSARRLMARIARDARALQVIARTAWCADRPLLAHLVTIRRCNLSCSYCNEYDSVSPPVDAALLVERIAQLAALGTGIVTLTGGEPLLHPQLDDLIGSIGSRGMVAGLITNGFLVSPERVRRLNEAGLHYLQISIDNVEPDATSQKSLRTLDRKLTHLAEQATFHVNVNSVLGGGLRRPEDVVTITKRARELGFTATIGLLHDGAGRVLSLGPREMAAYEEAVRLGGGGFTRLRGFQRNLVAGRANDWHCRAGARYLYICEDGLVHYCSQQRGRPGLPLSTYRSPEIRRAFTQPKPCAPHCGIGCVHRVSTIDILRPARKQPTTVRYRLPLV